MSNYIERHLYDAAGHVPGIVYYMRIVRRQDSYIWDSINKVMKAPADITWANSVTLLDEIGETGVYPIVIPNDWRKLEDVALESYGKPYVDLTTEQKEAVVVEHQAIKNIPGGTYDIVVYKQLGSECPANTDDVEKQFETKLGGSIFGF